MAPAGFAHSEIHGSSGYVLLTVAYRSLSRPSSASCAKASTVCPYHLLLDGSVHTYTPAASRSPVRSDAIFLKKKISSLSRYAALKVRRGRALETGHCALSRDERHQRERTGTVSSVMIVSVGDSCLPRKEVIQPHLPVRLPCYDFTPLTLHTFGASLPCGLGRRLRVQTTRVV